MLQPLSTAAITIRLTKGESDLTGWCTPGLCCQVRMITPAGRTVHTGRSILHDKLSGCGSNSEDIAAEVLILDQFAEVLVHVVEVDVDLLTVPVSRLE